MISAARAQRLFSMATMEHCFMVRVVVASAGIYVMSAFVRRPFSTNIVTPFCEGGEGKEKR